MARLTKKAVSMVLAIAMVITCAIASFPAMAAGVSEDVTASATVFDVTNSADVANATDADDTTSLSWTDAGVIYNAEGTGYTGNGLWLEYDFESTMTIDKLTVLWGDSYISGDATAATCTSRVPQRIDIKYFNGASWISVTPSGDEWAFTADDWTDEYGFEAVDTNKLRLYVYEVDHVGITNTFNAVYPEIRDSAVYGSVSENQVSSFMTSIFAAQTIDYDENGDISNLTQNPNWDENLVESEKVQICSGVAGYEGQLVPETHFNNPNNANAFSLTPSAKGVSYAIFKISAPSGKYFDATSLVYAARTCEGFYATFYVSPELDGYYHKIGIGGQNNGENGGARDDTYDISSIISGYSDLYVKVSFPSMSGTYDWPSVFSIMAMGTYTDVASTEQPLQAFSSEIFDSMKNVTYEEGSGNIINIDRNDEWDENVVDSNNVTFGNGVGGCWGNEETGHWLNANDGKSWALFNADNSSGYAIFKATSTEGYIFEKALLKVNARTCCGAYATISVATNINGPYTEVTDGDESQGHNIYVDISDYVKDSGNIYIKADFPGSPCPDWAALYALGITGGLKAGEAEKEKTYTRYNLFDPSTEATAHDMTYVIGMENAIIFQKEDMGNIWAIAGNDNSSVENTSSLEDGQGRVTYCIPLDSNTVIDDAILDYNFRACMGATTTIETSMDGYTWDWIIDNNADCVTKTISLKDKVSGASKFYVRVTVNGQDCWDWPLILNLDVKLATAEHLTHTETYSRVTTPATCLTDGVLTYFCSCGAAMRTETIAATGAHTYADTDLGTVVAPTCVAQGYTYKTCTICGEQYKYDFVPTVDHVFTDGSEVVTAPTCTEEGYTTKVCSVCGTSVNTDIVPALGHTYTDWEVTTPATCTVNGLETRNCTVCGNAEETRVITAPGHKLGEWVVTKAATCTVNGTKVRYCTVCDEIMDQESIPATGHTPGEYVEEDGQLVSRCTVCGEICGTKPIEVVVPTLKSKTRVDNAVVTGNNIVVTMTEGALSAKFKFACKVNSTNGILYGNPAGFLFAVKAGDKFNVNLTVEGKTADYVVYVVNYGEEMDEDVISLPTVNYTTRVSKVEMSASDITVYMSASSKTCKFLFYNTVVSTTAFGYDSTQGSIFSAEAADEFTVVLNVFGTERTYNVHVVRADGTVPKIVPTVNYVTRVYKNIVSDVVGDDTITIIATEGASSVRFKFNNTIVSTTGTQSSGLFSAKPGDTFTITFSIKGKESTWTVNVEAYHIVYKPTTSYVLRTTAPVVDGTNITFTTAGSCKFKFAEPVVSTTGTMDASSLFTARAGDTFTVTLSCYDGTEDITYNVSIVAAN